MQLDMFSNEEPERELPALRLLEDSSHEYKPRTQANTREADVTVAFAVDFDTPGERLTHKSAGPRYVDVAYGLPVSDAAARLSAFMAQRQGRTLNVAGNGIYTLDNHGVSQLAANQWVYEVLKLANQRVGLTVVRSGGQTGIDTAGLVAAMALKIPAIGLYPKGFRTRDVYKRDANNTPEALEKLLHGFVQKLSL